MYLFAIVKPVMSGPTTIAGPLIVILALIVIVVTLAGLGADPDESATTSSVPPTADRPNQKGTTDSVAEDADDPAEDDRSNGAIPPPGFDISMLFDPEPS